jgi:MFS family permease
VEEPDGGADVGASRDPAGRSGVRAAVRRIAIDLAPLRVSRDFRRIWLGLLVSQFGFQFTLVATYIQVNRLTGSAAAVGLIGLVGVVALVASTVVGGAFVDAYDRRTLLVVAQLGYLVAASVLLLGALHGEPPVWLIYAAVAIMACVSAIDSPVRSAMTPRLVGRELLPASLALHQVVWNTTALIGPGVGGIVIARFGLSWAYGLDLASSVVMLVAVLGIARMKPEPSPGARTGWAAVREGFAYVRGRPVLQSTFVIDIAAMVFGMPRALFPILAMTQFHRGEEIVGLLFAAPAVGALLGSLTTGWVQHVRHQGLAVIWAVALWGVGIAGFGVSGDRLWLALLFLAFAGAADVISAVFRTTILQLTVPDHLRGRLTGIHILVVTGGPRLGDLEAGLVASAFSPAASVVSGGLLCVVAAGVCAWLVPSFRRYHAGDAA